MSKAELKQHLIDFRTWFNNDRVRNGINEIDISDFLSTIPPGEQTDEKVNLSSLSIADLITLFLLPHGDWYISTVHRNKAEKEIINRISQINFDK